MVIQMDGAVRPEVRVSAASGAPSRTRWRARGRRRRRPPVGAAGADGVGAAAAAVLGQAAAVARADVAGRRPAARPGRFSSFDRYQGEAARPASLHKYAYAEADPVNGVDPSGNSMLKGLLIGVGIVAMLFAVFVPATFFGRRVRNYGVKQTTTPKRVAIVTGELGYLGEWQTAWNFVSINGFAADVKSAGHTVTVVHAPDEAGLARVLNNNDVVLIVSHGDNDDVDAANRPVAGFALGGTTVDPKDKVVNDPGFITANELQGKVSNKNLVVVSPACRLGRTSRMADAIGGKHFVSVSGLGSSATTSGAFQYVAGLLNGDNINNLNAEWKRGGPTRVVDPANKKYED